jgi:phosphate transport system protein
MQRHFVQELEGLKDRLIKMGSMAEQAIADSVNAMLERRPELAAQVFKGEKRINSYEIEIDDAVVDLLALQQPVASDLRFILAATKINNDLERIGDHAVNIAESAISYAGRPELSVKLDIPRMAAITQEMLRDAIDGFIHTAPAKCRAVLQNDDVIDDLNRKVVKDLVEIIRSNSAYVEQALDFVRVSRNLERVADLATNIAEEVIYIAEAQVVKHGLEKRATGS